jgi:BON domain
MNHMSHEEERQRSSRVVVETPTERREEQHVQTRRVPDEGSGHSTGVVAAVALTAIALTALVVYFLMNRGTDATQTSVNLSAAATPAPTAPPPVIVTQPAPVTQAAPPPPIIVQAPPASQPAPVVVPPASDPAAAAAAVEAKVSKAISDDTELGALGITVTVIDGTATLNGIVKTDAQKAGAERLAKGVSGVRRVDNKLVVEGQP